MNTITLKPLDEILRKYVALQPRKPY